MGANLSSGTQDPVWPRHSLKVWNGTMVQCPAVLCCFVYRRGRVLSEPSFLESSSLSSLSSSSSSFILILLFFLILFLFVLEIETAYTARQVLHHIPSPETCFLIIKSKQRVDACEVKAAYTWGKSLHGYRIERDGGWGRWLSEKVS